MDSELQNKSIIIKGVDYIMESCDAGVFHFDLKLLKLKKSGSESFIDGGYSMGIDRCVQKIIQHRMKRNTPYNGLREFYLAYKEEASKLHKELSLQINI